MWNETPKNEDTLFKEKTLVQRDEIAKHHTHRKIKQRINAKQIKMIRLKQSKRIAFVCCIAFIIVTGYYCQVNIASEHTSNHTHHTTATPVQPSSDDRVSLEQTIAWQNERMSFDIAFPDLSDSADIERYNREFRESLMNTYDQIMLPADVPNDMIIAITHVDDSFYEAFNFISLRANYMTVGKQYPSTYETPKGDFYDEVYYDIVIQQVRADNVSDNIVLKGEKITINEMEAYVYDNRLYLLYNNQGLILTSYDKRIGHDILIKMAESIE